VSALTVYGLMVTSGSAVRHVPIRGVVGEGVRARRVLMAENVDEGGIELGLSSECANSLWSEGDIRECSAACTRAWRA